MRPADTSLLVDAMCGRLVTYLRMCGYDAAYAPERGVEADADLARLADSEDRLLVTRDRALAGRVEGILLRARDIGGQLRELRDAGVVLALTDPERCSACNGRLDRVRADTATPDHAPAPASEPVWRCLDCGQCFWKGSHWDDVERRLAEL
jgi:uncharacterized protein with PIN domain